MPGVLVETEFVATNVDKKFARFKTHRGVPLCGIHIFNQWDIFLKNEGDNFHIILFGYNISGGKAR